MQKKLVFSVIALGISSIITQLIIFREFFSVFSGNELVLGVVFANWLLITGIGAHFGRKKSISLLIIFQFLIALLPFIHLLLVRNLRNILVVPGSLFSITQIFYSSFLLLFPYCFISGFLFPFYSNIFKKPGRVYFLDNIGNIIGGLLFSFIFVYLFNHFQIIFFIMSINLAASLILSFYYKKTVLKYLSILLLLILLLISFIDFNMLTTKMQYSDQEVLFQKNSLYGNLVVTKTGDQLNFYENGVSLFFADNFVNSEETVHYAMSQHDDPKTVLLISGGISGTTSEILKYNITSIDYLELDPLLISLGRKYTSNLDNLLINIISQDGRLFIKKTKNKYDVIIIDLPDPGTAMLNRFYTVEFFTEAKQILNKGGILSTSLSSSENYLNDALIKTNSILYTSLINVFDNVIIIPSGRNYFIASDSAISHNLTPSVSTLFVNNDYLKGILTKDRIDYLNNSIQKTRLNKDFNPILYYQYTLYWLSYFKFKPYLFLMLISILVILYVLKLSPITFSIFSTGFTASSIQIILLLSFQIIYGYVYSKLGIIMTAFLIGLAVGSYVGNNYTAKQHYIKLEFLLIFLLVFSSLLLLNVHFQFIIPSLSFLLALIVGMEFSVAAKLHNDASKLYNADLIGAALGAFLAAAILIPLVGILNVFIILVFIKLVSCFVVIKHKAYK
ncbi:MAG: hypothetical protein ABIC04_00440 [Nanoarchaeota archaeon]